MFFIQEGIVELIFKQSTFDRSQKVTKFASEKVYLDKGCYFGEV